MKKLFLALIILFIFINGCSTNETEKTVEEAVEKTGRKITQMIHKEKVKDGLVVFFKQSINNDKGTSLASGYVKKTLGGWKWVYGGGHVGYTYQYFPYTYGTPFPLIFGEIANPKIKEVKIMDEERNIENTARIVSNKNTRIWFFFLDKSHGSLFKIVGLSEEGEILTTEKVDISEDETSITEKIGLKE